MNELKTGQEPEYREEPGGAGLSSLIQSRAGSTLMSSRPWRSYNIGKRAKKKA